MGIPQSNHPFVLNRCSEVQERLNNLYSNNPAEPRCRLEVWARGHFKTSILTIAATIQYHLRYPEQCTCIFSFKKPIAEGFVASIKSICEMEIMVKCFPDVLFEDPYRQSSSWSNQNGINFKRQNTSRKECTIESSGLESMEQGNHFERQVFDDIETPDVVFSMDNINKCFSNFEMASYMTTLQETDIQIVIGTYYHHEGPLMKIRKKVDGLGNSKFVYTKISGISDNDQSVFLTDKQMNEERLKLHFNAQICCDPTPQFNMKLNPSFLREIKSQDVPKNLVKFLLVDPAGDASVQKSSQRDSWAIELIGVRPPQFGDDWGISEVYLLDAIIEQLSEVDAVETIVNMYTKGGKIRSLGYEKVGGSTPIVAFHVQEALKKRNRIIKEQDHTLEYLKTGGVNKKDRILQALMFPLNNGKIFISTAVPVYARDRLKAEMEKFPVWHDDGIDCLAYIWKVIEEDWAKRAIANAQDTKIITIDNILDRIDFNKVTMF
jgi:hypothetical protein